MFNLDFVPEMVPFGVKVVGLFDSALWVEHPLLRALSSVSLHGPRIRFWPCVNPVSDSTVPHRLCLHGWVTSIGHRQVDVRSPLPEQTREVLEMSNATARPSPVAPSSALMADAGRLVDAVDTHTMWAFHAPRSLDLDQTKLPGMHCGCERNSTSDARAGLGKGCSTAYPHPADKWKCLYGEVLAANCPVSPLVACNPVPLVLTRASIRQFRIPYVGLPFFITASQCVHPPCLPPRPPLPSARIRIRG